MARNQVIGLTLYTADRDVLKLSAQIYPLQKGEATKVTLEVQREGIWLRIATAPLLMALPPGVGKVVPERSITVLEVAIASDEMSVRQRNEAQGRAIEMAHRFGFEYPSDIGVHPLGSKGTPSQRVADPRSQSSRTPQSALADFAKNLAKGGS